MSMPPLVRPLAAVVVALAAASFTTPGRTATRVRFELVDEAGRPLAGSRFEHGAAHCASGGSLELPAGPVRVLARPGFSGRPAPGGVALPIELEVSPRMPVQRITWPTSEIVPRVVDAGGAPIEGSRVEIADQLVDSGDTLRLPALAFDGAPAEGVAAPGYAVRTFPGLGGAAQGALLWRREPALLPGPGVTELRITWEQVPVSVAVVDQHGEPIPGSRWQAGPVAAVGGESRLMPTLAGGGPAAPEGAHAAGYPLRIHPGILDQEQETLLHREAAPLRPGSDAATRVETWETFCGCLEVSSPRAPAAGTGDWALEPLGGGNRHSRSRLPVTEDRERPPAGGAFAGGYPFAPLQPDGAVGPARLAELWPGGWFTVAGPGEAPRAVPCAAIRRTPWFRVTADPSGVRLEWQAETPSPVTGWSLYRGRAEEPPVTRVTDGRTPMDRFGHHVAWDAPGGPGPWTYRLTAFDRAGNEWTAAIGRAWPGGEDADAADTPWLRLRGPQPARGPLELVYGLSKAGPVRLDLFGIRGERVARLESGWREAGTHRVAVDEPAAAGTGPAAGLYFARLVTAEGNRTLRVTWLPR